MDPNTDPVLDDLAQRAYNFSINLDGRIDRLPTSCNSGRCAVVYKGTLLPDNIEVALKTAAGDLARRGIREVIKDAVREVYTWSKLRHKNVHPLLGITTEFDHTISFVSAWMEKGNAIDYVQDKEVDPRPLIEGIARGLHYLHDYKPASIFHGDLKGSNVLVSQDGRALLTDFGFTRVVNSSLKMTVDKICGGALNWMAPEIISGGEVSAEGDVWAFGMTVLELFTRNIPRYPPSRPSEDETLSRLTDRWWELCSSCWNGQPYLRPQMSAVVKSISLLSAEELRSDAVGQNRVLTISGIEIRNTGTADSAELIIGGKHHKTSCQGEGSVLRADFNPPLELPLQDQFSLSIVSQPEPGLTRRADLSLDARDVLTKSDQHTFRRTLEHLEIILEISPIASPDLLIPTTDELLQQCPQFRILLIGKTGVGKTSLIYRTFGVEEARPEHDKRGKANIEKPMVSKRNQRFILHDSEGFEPGENNNIELAKSFIKRRRTHEDVKEQLHAIWLSFQIPLQTYGQRMLETGMEDFLRDKKNILGDIPTVFVFTKYDKLCDEIENRWVEEGREYDESDVDEEAEQYLKKNCMERIERLTGEYNVPWLAVSTKARYQSKLKDLVQLTYQKVAEHFVQQQGTGPLAVTTVTGMAQRIDASLHIATSITIGARRYWEAVSIGNVFWGQKNKDCLQVIHTDIVKVWNLCDPSEVLMGNKFRASIFDLVNFLEGNPSPNFECPSVRTSGGFPWKKWVYQIFGQAPEEQRKFMAYIVDLTHVMDILFMLTHDKNEQGITLDIIQSAIAAYRESKKRRNAYAQIKAFPGTIRVGDITSEVKSLVSSGFDDDKELKQCIQRIANSGNSTTRGRGRITRF